MPNTERRNRRALRRQARIREIKWDKLDNTAHLFPVIAGIGMSNVYRASVVLRETVNRELLQQALDKTLPRFPVFNSRLQQGMFWYYFEENGKRAPKVTEESTYPCQYIEPATNRDYLFRVTYYKCRINLEVFHVLTDGLGGMHFLRELTYQYLRLAHPALMEQLGDGLDAATSLNVTDSYVENYKKREVGYKSEGAYRLEEAYELTGATFYQGEMSVDHMDLPLDQVKQRAKSYQATLNEYLVAAVIWSIYGSSLERGVMREPITVSVPVNLRPYFDSVTTKNFFAMVTAVFRPEHERHSYKEVLRSVQASLAPQMTREHLEGVISYNVSNEKKAILRAVPLALKKPAMKYVYNSSVRANTTTVTNVGALQVAKAYAPYIENYTAFISRSKGQDLKCAVSSYENHLNVIVTSVLREDKIQQGLFRFFREEGLSMTWEDNGVRKKDGVGEKHLDKKNRIHEGDKKEQKESAYPQVKRHRQYLQGILHIYTLVMVGVFALLRGMNHAMSWERNWDYLVGACLLFVALTFWISAFSRRGYRFKMLTISALSVGLVFVIDCILGFGGWSLAYVLPGALILFDGALLVLMLVNSRNWQSYLPAQLLILLVSMGGLGLHFAGVISQWLVPLVAFGVALAVFVGTLLIGGGRGLQELRRRFHL